MNKIFLLLFPCFIAGFTMTNQSANEISPNFKIVTGQILEDESQHFYIQDFESGDLIELNFENEVTTQLTFDDFLNVEISGNYNIDNNSITVDEINMIENFGQLELVYKEP